MVQACFLGVEQRFAKTYHRRSNEDLIGSLGVLPGSRLAHVLHILRIDVKKLAHGGDSILGAAHHSDELAVSGSDVATRDRGIDGVHAATLRLLSNELGELGAARRVVDERSSTLHVLQDALAVV